VVLGPTCQRPWPLLQRRSCATHEHRSQAVAGRLPTAGRARTLPHLLAVWRSPIPSPPPLLHTATPFKTVGHCTHAPLFSPWHVVASRTTRSALPSPLLLLVQPSTPKQAEIGQIAAAPALSSPSSVSTTTDCSLSNLSQARLSTTPPGVTGTDHRRCRPPVRHRHVGMLPPHSPILAWRVTETSPVLVPVTLSHGSRLHVPIGHAAASALRAVIACARAHATPLALGVLDHFWSLSGPTIPDLGPDLALALLLVYSFLKFVFSFKICSKFV
jgi:hypothetical protein